MTFDELTELRKKLKKVWSRETAHPDWACLWETWRPSLGQCYVTALIVQDRFGGNLVRYQRHLWNRLPDGTEVDLTSDQLKGDGFTPFYAGMGKMLPNGYGAKRSNPRYKLLKKRLQSLESR